MTGKRILLLIGAIIFVWALSGLIIFLVLGPSDRGTFGDMFGAINALFSGLALAGVVVAILLQRTELQLQREELKMTRTELQRSAEAASDSANSLQKQAKIAERAAELQAMSTLLQTTTDIIEELNESWRSQPDTIKRIGFGRPNTKELKAKRQAYMMHIEGMIEIPRVQAPEPPNGEKADEDNP